MLIYVAIPSAGCFTEEKTDRGSKWKVDTGVLTTMAYLQHHFPSYTLLSPSLQNYQVLPWLPDNWTASYGNWEKQCRSLLKVCEALWVLAFPGWRGSNGVTKEIEMATEYGIPCRVLTPVLTAHSHYWPPIDTIVRPYG